MEILLFLLFLLILVPAALFLVGMIIATDYIFVGELTSKIKLSLKSLGVILVVSCAAVGYFWQLVSSYAVPYLISFVVHAFFALPLIRLCTLKLSSSEKWHGARLTWLIMSSVLCLFFWFFRVMMWEHRMD